MMRLIKLPVNQVYVFTFGDSLLRLGGTVDEEPLFFSRPKDAEAAARRHGLRVTKSHAVVVAL